MPVVQALACCLLVLALALPGRPASAQASADRMSTEQRLQELRNQIRQDEARLSQTTQAEQASLQTLRNIDREIVLRRELTGSLQQRLLELSQQSDSLLTSLSSLEEDLGELREQYRYRAIHAYKYGRLHDLALILAAESINQMLVRVRYLTRFTDERREKLDVIRTAADTLEARRIALQEARAETEQLLAQADAERQELGRLQSSRQQVVQQLQTQRTALQQDLSAKRQAATQFETRLRELVAGATTRRNNATDSRELREFRELSGSFRANQGRLPWPASGVVMEPYGEVINPVYGTSTPNPGLLIATNPQDAVRAVFDGVVLSVSVIPEFGRYVLVEHGEYQSAYSNFSLIYVSEGDRIEAGQVIGRAGTEEEPKGAGVFFALFENGAAFDPMRWLAPR